jgi:hypothetical protein
MAIFVAMRIIFTTGKADLQIITAGEPLIAA